MDRPWTDVFVEASPSILWASDRCRFRTATHRRNLVYLKEHRSGISIYHHNKTPPPPQKKEVFHKQGMLHYGIKFGFVCVHEFRIIKYDYIQIIF